MTRAIRIGCGSGFWGDSQMAPPQLIRHGQLDYLVLDYLAEITMALLGRSAIANPSGGWATDFVSAVMAPHLEEIAHRRIRVVTNAGGLNPAGCRAALSQVARQAGVPLAIAVVEGDDLLPRAAELRGRLPELPPEEDLLSLNAYLGAAPIALALSRGADVVITGRCVDSALVLGPLWHEHGWGAGDLDLLAAGSLAGHIVECGAQATGGLFTDWELVPGGAGIGYPIVLCAADGSFVLTKPPGTGGLVTPAVVAEQILYEIGDPAAYLLPDVSCDLSGVTLRPAGPDQVAVSGARGRPPPATYKVSATYQDGYRCTAVAMVGGRAAARKAEHVAAALLERSRGLLAGAGLGDFRAVHVEVLGAEASYGPHRRVVDPREVILKLAVHHDSSRAATIFAREIASAGTSLTPGLTGMLGGRPRVSPLIRLRSYPLDRAEVPVQVVLSGERLPVAAAAGEQPAPPAPEPAAVEPAVLAAQSEGEGDAEEDLVTVPLIALAHGRSGDKGDDVNIGIIARDERFLPAIRRALSPAAVAGYFAHILAGGAAGRVERFELPGLGALNFVLYQALDGGGLASLRFDAQGKALGQMLLDFPVPVPRSWLGERGLLRQWADSADGA